MPRKKRNVYKNIHRKILDYIRGNPGTDSELIAKHFKISDMVAWEITRDMASVGLIGKYTGK